MTGLFYFARNRASDICVVNRVTLLLLFVIDRLIAMQPGTAGECSRAGTLTFIRIDEETDVQTIVDPPPRRDSFDPPPTPPRPRQDQGDELTIDVGLGSPVAPRHVNDAIELRPSDGPVAPRRPLFGEAIAINQFDDLYVAPLQFPSS